MVVQHNLRAMNSNRMLGLTTKAQSKSTEKLSSGYKINRAADDAAGLSISEKMRKQIRGLTQASANAQDGISAVQTAEGALTEVHDMLQRMNELAVKSSNGTNSADDRTYIQNEIDQLVTEIDRVAETTKFNETYLLQGDARGKVTAAAGVANVNAPSTTAGTMQATGIKVDLAVGADLTAGTVKLGSVTAKSDTAGTNLDMKELGGALKTALDALKGEQALTITAGTGANAGKWQIGTTGAFYDAAQLKDMGLNVGTVTTDISLKKEFTANDKIPGGVSIDTAALDLTNVAIGQDINITLKANRDANDVNVITASQYDPTYVPAALDLDLQVGADTTAANKIGLSITAMTATSLSLVDENGKLLVDGDTSANADKAVNTIASAIQKVSTQRSALGAVQNRLEHTINNLDNVVENTTAAESQIRDTNMATEMAKYSNNNILAQAGQSMLAQSNQANQGVLALLQ